jgi:hypothetical protein
VGLGQSDAVQRGTKLAVADTAESVTLVVGRPDRDRRRTAVAGIGVAGDRTG